MTDTVGRVGEPDGLVALDEAATRVLGARRERELLQELDGCKRKLAEALAHMPADPQAAGADDPQGLAEYYARAALAPGPEGARLGAIYRRYRDLRTTLALANVRLVAHVAKKFRDRGVAYSDLVQEGFCGLLEAIDRFELAHGTKLATYATWWVRQAMQRAVAAGAYPVRLTPRHLRHLAQNQEGLGGTTGASAEMLHRIHAATRPTLSLDTPWETDGHFNLAQTLSDPEGDHTGDVDRDEALETLLESLQPRERQVLALRFGLGGGESMSLSQVGDVLGVSKERIRQIQDRAMTKLRSAAGADGLALGLS